MSLWLYKLGVGDREWRPGMGMLCIFNYVTSQIMSTIFV